MRAVITLCLLSAIFLAAPVSAGDRAVARVGNEAITSHELENAVIQNPGISREKALDLLIDRRLVLVWAAGKNISVPDEEIDQALASIRERNNLDEEQFEKALESRGETMKMFRADLREQLIINKALRMALASRVHISDDELQEIYHETYPPQITYTVSHILFTVEEGASTEEEEQVRLKAVSILDDIRAGSSFSEMAAKYSQDPGTAGEGGHIGTFSQGELLPELEKLAAGLEPGEVGGPVRTSAGYHLLLLESRNFRDPPPLEEVRNSLEKSLMARKEQSARSEWLKELEETTYIEVFPDEG
jgi:parvulin-like peptidyl-prolyl isomerase